MSQAITVAAGPASHGPQPPATRPRRRGRRLVLGLTVVLGALLLTALALGLVAGEHLQSAGAADWPLQVWINGEELGTDLRAQLAGSGLGAAASLGVGLAVLAVLVVLLPLLLGLTVALPLLLIALLLLGVSVGLVALMGLPLLLLGLVALPLMLPLLALWWLLRRLLR